MDKNLKMVLELLDQAVTEPHKIQENMIIFTEQQLAIIPYIEQVQKNESSAVAHIYYVVKSPLFEDDFFEVASGIGSDVEQAITQSVMSFSLGALCAWCHLLKGEYQHMLKTNFFGKEKEWNIVESCGIRLQGEGAPQEIDGIKTLWDVVKNRIPEFIGNQKLYWMKAYVAKQMDGSTVGEFRINNQVIYELSELLNQYVASLDTNNTFYSCKDIYFVSQSEDTYTPYPYSKKQIEEAVTKTLEIFSRKKELEDEEILEMMFCEIGDESLSSELFSWIPEMCAQYYWNQVRYGDFIDVRFEKETLHVAKTQFTPYYWVNQFLIQCFESKRYSFELLKELILRSATAHVLSQVIEKNGEDYLSNISLTAFSMYFGENYQVR